MQKEQGEPAGVRRQTAFLFPLLSTSPKPGELSEGWCSRVVGGFPTALEIVSALVSKS